MNRSAHTQRGFAAPAMFVAVALAFAASLGVKGKDGTSVADAVGLTEPREQTEFAAVEPGTDAQSARPAN